MSDPLAAAPTRHEQVKALCASALASVPIDLYSCIVGQVHVLTQVLEKMTAQLKLGQENVTANIEGGEVTVAGIIEISNLLLDAAKEHGKPKADEGV
jgi:hypothetical protein